MKKDLCQCLPPEIMINIFSKLPIGSIIQCRSVCKSWHDLIESCEFGKSHLCNAKPISGLAFFEDCSKHYCFYQYVDEHEHDEPSPKRHFSIALNFSLPTHLKHVHIRDISVNGLLLFIDTRIWPHTHYICNPLTRDYIKLPLSSNEHHYVAEIGFGFGVSKMSGEYKLVRVLSHRCEVYTLGTGSWRSVAPCSYHLKTCYDHKTTATFLNWNLHLLLHDSQTVVGIFCFDLETELFTIFSPPPSHIPGCFSSISALEEGLACCHNEREGLVIWLMKEYGDDKSWSRKFIITNASGLLGYGFVFPIKVFEDGDILIAQPCYSRVLCYFNKTNNTIEYSEPPFLNATSTWPGSSRSRAVSYTPSFLPLKTFSVENVSSF